TVINAPIAPGLVLPVGVLAWRPLRTGELVEIGTTRGVVSFDGERELELVGTTGATVRLAEDGPLCVDVTAVMSQAARAGLFRSDRPVV
ncbi:ATP-NAD kinase, partial [Streptomyces milbemycinicus]